MSNFGFSNTLDGLNNINANDINTDNINCDYLNVNINSSVPLVTPYSTNSNQIASCAFVQDAFANNLLGYALLNSPNTFTASNTFNGIINKNNTTFDYSDYRFVSIQGGGESTQIYQVGGGLTLTSITNNKFIVMNTKDISGNDVNGLFCGFGNQAYLQGALNNRIDITGTQATIGGTSVPKITTQPLTASNNNEIASTAFVKNQGYALLGSNNTFTGINTFNNNVILNNLFVSNNVQSGTGIYENQFFGDVYCYKSFTSQNGLFIQNQITPGAITYASIDPSGNLQAETIASSSTITAVGNISSSANISGATILTLGSVTANQLLIKDPANVGSSSISQTGSTLNINAISNNVSPFTTLTLGTRSTGNIYTEILSGNANDLFLGNNCTTARIQPANLNIQSTSITTNPTSATITGGQLIINNTLTTFNDNVVLNESTTMNNTFTFNDGANATQFDQNGVNLTVYSTGGIKMGSGFSDNIICTSNRAYLQGTIGNTIDMNGTQATIGGSLVPKITTQPLAASNTNEIASTQWTKSQLASYAPLTNLNNYALLTTTTQTLTGTNTFINTVPSMPIVIKNTTSSNSGGLLISGTGSYNGINNPGDFAVVGFGPTINNGILNLTTWANGSCGIKIDNDTITYNAPFTCGYLQLGAPITSKTNFNIGYQWQIGGAAFNGTSWGTASGTYNILTIAWNGSGDYTLGVWQVDIVIIINCLNSPTFSLCWNTVSNTSMDITEKCAQSYGATTFGAAGHQITRLSFTLNITNFLQNFWLNSLRSGGSSLSSNTTYSQIKFTRIA
jgi:hypothetical protein